MVEVTYMRKRKVSSCPKCGKTDVVVPILHGYPSDEAMEAAERDEIVLAGCMVGDVDPNYYCRRCIISFDFERPELASPEAAQRGWIEESSSRE